MAPARVSRRFRGLRALTWSLLFLSPAASGCDEGEPSRRLLAVVVDLSGPDRAVGRDVWDAARLALREALRKERVELLVQDDRGDPERAARLAGYLRELPEVIAVIAPGSRAAAGPALAAYGRGAGVPTLVPITLPPEATRENPWALGMAPAADYLGESLAWFLVTELSVDSAAVVVDTTALGRALESGFVRELGRLGGGVSRRVTLDPALLGTGPTSPQPTDAAVLLAMSDPKPVGGWIRALRLGMTAPILTGIVPETSLPPESLAGVYYPLLFDPGAGGEAGAFTARFEDAFTRPPGESAALAYDAARLVLEGLRAGAGTRAELRDWLGGGERAVTRTGVTGTFFFSREHAAVREVVIASPAAGRAGVRRAPALDGLPGAPP